ncbi:MAG: hypothetical protein MUQ10_02535 [Anaerolineae bacterium]|nr:hypothetical protein [Anaerolineae bacterium]
MTDYESVLSHVRSVYSKVSEKQRIRCDSLAQRETSRLEGNHLVETEKPASPTLRQFLALPPLNRKASG